MKIKDLILPEEYIFSEVSIEETVSKITTDIKKIDENWWKNIMKMKDKINKINKRF